MFLPNKKAAQFAFELQQASLAGERNEDFEADPNDARWAVIHTRQDAILHLAWLTSIHRQLVNINRSIWIIGILLLFAVGGSSS